MSNRRHQEYTKSMSGARYHGLQSCHSHCHLCLNSQPPIPQRPMLSPSMSTKAKLVAISQYIAAFEYNHTGKSYFNLRRDRGLKHVTTTAKEIMREALPIQCVEAVFLAFFLTAEMLELERFPLSFKSKSGDQIYRHLVLAVFDSNENLWGALGMSRRATLQQKDVKFSSLSALVDEYRQSYVGCSHELLSTYVGLPLPHNLHSMEPVKWRVLKLSLANAPWHDVAKALDQYAKNSRWIREYYARTGRLPTPFEAEASETSADGVSRTRTEVAVSFSARSTPRARFSQRRNSRAITPSTHIATSTLLVSPRIRDAAHESALKATVMHNLKAGTLQERNCRPSQNVAESSDSGESDAM